MRLLELTPAERVFLDERVTSHDAFERRLSARLATVFSARLRMPIVLRSDVSPTGVGEPVQHPTWRPDDALASLWLTRRLGGARVLGAARFVPRTLIDMLDQQLAEYWIESAGDTDGADGMGAARAWTLAGAACTARLALVMPDEGFDKARWAQGVIERG